MAFRIAVSGLRAATADLDVTGNNIANSNTTGFKASRAEFADVYAATSIGTSQDSIGQGVSLTAVAQQFGQGTITFTDNNLDLAISGEGFFALEDTSGARIYSRAGAFGVDENGVVVNSLGQRLVAFQATGGTLTGVTGPLQLSSSNIAPQATTQIDVGVNLDADAEPLAPRVLEASNMLAPYELARWRTTAIDDRTWSGNWKLVMENGMESLHHPGLHPETVEPQVPGLGAADRR